MEELYLQVKEPDMVLFGNAMQQVRGNVPIDQFAFDCGYNSYRAFWNLANGKRSRQRISEDLVDRIVDAGEEKTVSKDEFEAAKGYIPKEYAEAVRDQMYAEDTSVISFQETVNAAKKEKAKQLNYLENISSFCDEMDDNTRHLVKKGAWSFYRFDGATDIVKIYSELKRNIKPFEDYYDKAESHDELPKEASLAHDFDLVMYDMLTRKSIKKTKGGKE